MLPDWLKSYFRFHRRERRGFAILMVLLLAIITYNVWLRLTMTSRNEGMLLEFGPSIAEFERAVSDRPESQPFSFSDDEGNARKRRVAERFDFDPNTLDSAGWVRLGFSPKQSASIVKYRFKGGTFRRPEDLMKLFMVDSLLYLELQPYVHIMPSERNESIASNAFPKWSEPPSVPMVDINRADTLELENIRGIGPSFARRIHRYRERLGGFVAQEQLLEVFGMDTARFEGMLPQITIDTTVRIRININTADYKELIRHPYLDKNQVRTIIRYREQHGRYASVDDLLKIHLINDDDMKRLRPYLIAD